MKLPNTSGYILLSRKIINSQIIDKPPEYLKVWIYLLAKANFTESNNLKRGQGFVTFSELQELLSYNVGYRKEKPSRNKIWTIVEWLRNTHEADNEADTNLPMIETTKVTHGLIYNIVKYDVYQSPDLYERDGESNNEKTTKQQRSRQQPNNKYKNDKKDKKDNKDIYGEFKNVKLTQDELEKLKSKFPDYQDRIEKLSNYVASTGKRYSSHYATILNWSRKEEPEREVKKYNFKKA